MKQQVSTPLIIGIVVVVVAVLGFFLFKSVGSGPQIQGTDSMPPNVRAAFTHSHQPQAPASQP
jgi:hypothetical protein